MAFDPISLGLMGVGALGGGISNLFGGGGFKGKKEQFRQFDQYDPQQSQMSNWLLQQGQQNSNFGDIANQEVNRFNQDTIPGLAERFTAMGNGQRSSGFQNALGMAGSDLGTRLAALRSQFGLQQLGMGMRPHIENQYIPRQAGAIEGFFGGLSKAAGPAMMGSMMGKSNRPRSFSDELGDAMKAGDNYNVGSNIYNGNDSMMY